MKKLLAFSIISFLFAPVLVMAITPGTIPGGGELGIKQINSVREPNDLLDLAASIVGYVYTVFFIVAVLFILFAAFNYLTGGDAPDKIKTAHSQLLYAGIAIVVALLAVTAQVIIGNFIRGDSNGSQSAGSDVQAPSLYYNQQYYSQPIPQNFTP